MWPSYVNMTKEDGLAQLRHLELKTYAMLVSTLRAQGALTQEKRRIFKEVSKALNISVERHKCEVRRAINDEKLNTIAYYMHGSGASAEEWHYEGRRSFPLLQRISPQTLHPILAKNLSHQYQELAQNTPSIGREVTEEQPHEEDPIDMAAEELEENGDQPIKTYPSKKTMNKPAEETIPNVLHKTVSVPMGKVTKLNLEKFKILPNSTFQVTNKNGKKIIPLSQLQMLGSKGGIKVLPIGKIFGKNITMTRLTPQQAIKGSILQSFTETPAISKIKVENIEPLDDLHVHGDIQRVEEEEEEEVVVTTENEEAREKLEEFPVPGEEAPDLETLMEIDKSEFIAPEPEVKECLIVT